MRIDVRLIGEDSYDDRLIKETMTLDHHAYLARIRNAGTVVPSIETLHALHGVHAAPAI
jgi:hypothetical protein